LLEHGDALITESEEVTKYVAEHVATSDDMYPKDHKRIDRFLNVWNSVTSTYYNYLTASGERSTRTNRIAFTASLKHLEPILSEHDGDFVLGNTFSVAECMAAPWIQRFYVTLPYFRGIHIIEDIIPKECEEVAKWMEVVRKRPSVQVTACADDEMLNAARKYYVSYVSPGAPGTL
jgi:glutathione S-transferase